MKIIVWGAGKVADDYMRYYDFRLRNHIEVIGFIDSYKEIDYFWNKPVYKTTEDIMSDYDYLVVFIWKAKEILECINQKQNFTKGKILSRYAFFEMCINEHWIDFHSTSVLFLGDRLTYEYAEYRASFTFKSFLYKEHFDGNLHYNYDYIFLCPPRLSSDDDERTYEDTLRKELGNEKDILNLHNILTWKEWHYYMECDRVIRDDSSENKMFYILAVSDPIRGWGNLLFQILGGIRHAKRYGYIPVIDMQNVKNQYLAKEMIGKHNAWTDFFEPLNEYDLNHVYKNENCILCGTDSNMYEDKVWTDVTLKREIRDEIETWVKNRFDKNSKVLGVVYRGTDYYSAGTGHAHPQDKVVFLDDVMEYAHKGEYTQVYLATEVKEMVDLFVKEFGKKLIVYPQNRYNENERNFLSEIKDERENGSYLRGKEYLTVLGILSKCDGIYGSDNGATRMAIIMNQGRFKDICII